MNISGGGVLAKTLKHSTTSGLKINVGTIKAGSNPARWKRRIMGGGKKCQ